MMVLALVVAYALLHWAVDAVRLRRVVKDADAWATPAALAAPGLEQLTSVGQRVVLVLMGALVLRQSAGVDVVVALLLAPVVTVARVVSERQGMVRAAYHLARWFHLGHRSEPIAFAVVCGARALLHRKHADGAAIIWLEERLRLECGPNRRAAGGVTLLAGALLAEARGDDGCSRQTLRALVELTPRGTPTDVVTAAQAILLADAAQRGAWTEVLSICGERQDNAVARFMAAVARRILLTPNPPSDFQLILAWVLLPTPWRAWPMLQRVLRMEVAPPPAVQEAVLPSVDSASPLAGALAAHATLLDDGVRVPSQDLVKRVAKAWDLALNNPETRKLAVERSHALGVGTGDLALHRLRAAVEQDLARVIRLHRVPVGEVGGEGILAGAARALREALLTDVENAVDTLSRRTESRRALPPLEEWQEFLELERALDAAAELGGPMTRRLAFSSMHGRACSWAVWLFNDRKERALGNAVFQWLLREATAVGDAQAMDLQQRNAACG